jgi:3-oxoadipate enol-lactonase
VLIDIDGIRLNVLDEGTGHPVLFLHGLGGSWRDWEPQLDSFSRQYRVIVPEHRGHGRSDRPLGRYSIARFAADVDMLCRRLDIDHCYVVGLSMGGMIAQHLGLARPELVDALVLADTSASVDSSTGELLRGVVAGIRQDGMAIVQTLAESLMGNALSAVGLRPDLVRNNLRESSGNDPYAYANALWALTEHDLSDQLAMLRPPTLVLRGEHDPLVDEKGMVELAEAIPSAEFVTVAAAGHLVNLDQPDEFDRLVKEFFARHPCLGHR